jgi:hypothetical protein
MYVFYIIKKQSDENVLKRFGKKNPRKCTFSIVAWLIENQCKSFSSLNKTASTTHRKTDTLYVVYRKKAHFH